MVRLEEHSADGIKTPFTDSNEVHSAVIGIGKAFVGTGAHRRLLKYKAITVSNAETRKEVCLDCGVETGQRIMMVISSKPKQSHPLIPHSLSAPVYVCVSLSALNPLTHSFSPSLPLSASHSPHIDRTYFFTVPELQFKTHFSLFAVNPNSYNF